MRCGRPSAAAPATRSPRRVIHHSTPVAVLSALLTALLMPPSGHAATDRRDVGVRRLDNGLQAVWEADHRQPIVAIDARIKGGLRGEGALVGTGVTHFIEHLLFKGTPTRPPGTIDQEVRRYGGSINAFTSYDTTGVTLFVEAQYLRPALEMLADILQHAVFDPAEVEKERAVIISEIQMNLDDPDRRLHHLFWNEHYREHPYRHPILGYRPLLEALTVEELRRFYAAQYQPQNIVIGCVGDLDGAAMPALLTEMFGGWRRGRVDPSQQLVPAEPPALSSKEAVDELAVQQAYMMLGVTSTRLADADLYPLDVLASILGHGRSSRLYQALVQREQVAYAAEAWNYTPYDPGVFGIGLRTDPEKIGPARSAATAVVREVQRNGVHAEELAKAKRQVAADYVFGLQSVEARAGDLANSLAMTGDPLFSRRYVEGIDAVTAEQVQAVARRYFDPGKMTTAIVRPPVLDGAAKTARPAGAVEVSKTVLDNGLTVLVGVDRALPMATAVLSFRGGVRVEDEANQGLSNLTASMLIRGTRKRSATDIATAIESLGGAMEPFSGRDGFGLGLQVLAADVPQAIGLLHELATDSVFSKEELEIQRQLILKQLAAQEDEIFDVGGRLLRRALFGQHPYRFHPLGTKESVAGLRREDCQQFASTWMTPSNGVLAIFGDVDPDGVLADVRARFKNLSRGQSAWPQELPVRAPETIERADRAMDKEQALVMLGFLGSTQRADDRYAVDVMTAALSGMSGRLFQSVRERHGLSYTLGAVHVPAWDPGYLMVYAATRSEEREKVLAVLEDELGLVVREGFSADEVEQAKRFLIGNYRTEVQQLTALARRAALDELYGLGYEAWRRYEADITAVTPAAVHEAAKRYLTLDHRAQVVIVPTNGHAGRTD